MKTRRNFVKGLLGFIGGLTGVNLTKAGNISPVGTKNKGKVEIEYFCYLAGSSNPFMMQHRGVQQTVPVILECPVIIHWEGWKYKSLDGQRVLSRKGCPVGCLEITIKECVGNFHLLNNVDEAKLTNWIVQELEKVPVGKRSQPWVRQVSLNTIKLWGKR